MAKKKMNWFQARHQADSGKTRDEVDHPDPAAAPLGTDEEAGGARTSQEDIAASEEAHGIDWREEDPGRDRARPDTHDRQ